MAVLYDSHDEYLVGGQLQLETKVGHQIPNDRRQQKSPVAMEAANEHIRGRHPAVECRSLNSTYNCMGMVFASRRTVAYPADLDMILRDDGYRRLQKDEVPEIGDVVIYKDETGEATHVGLVAKIVVDLTLTGGRYIKILSQWGFLGEYFHDPEDVEPIYGQPEEYWTDRI